MKWWCCGVVVVVLRGKRKMKVRYDGGNKWTYWSESKITMTLTFLKTAYLGSSYLSDHINRHGLHL